MRSLPETEGAVARVDHDGVYAEHLVHHEDQTIDSPVQDRKFRRSPSHRNRVILMGRQTQSLCRRN